MDKTLDLIEVEPILNISEQPLQESISNSCDTPKALQPMASRQIESELGITKRMTQLWFPLVQKAYFWIPESQLRSGGGKYVKYSVFCIEQFLAIQQAKAIGKTADEWVSEIHAVNNQHLTPKSQSSSLAPTTADKDAVLATEKLQASTVVLQDAKQVLQDAYQQQPTLAKNLAKLFGARFKQEFSNAYATEVKQAVTEVLDTTNFER